MIHRITFKNYKLFKKKQTLDILPITILIGKNNTGKSAVLKLCTMIEGSLNSEEPQAFELENSGVAIGNDYHDVIYGKQFKTLELELFQKSSREENREDYLKTNILIDKTPIIDYWKFNDFLELNRVDHALYENENDLTKYKCGFLGFDLANYFYNDKPDSSGDVLPFNFQLYTDFIGAIRAKSKKTYDVTFSKNLKSNIDGGNLYNFLIEDFLTTDKKYFNQISNWISEKFEGWNLNIEYDNYISDTPAIIELVKGGLKVNLSETGMGISQSIPLVIRAFKPCEQETLIIIEEPESHLHPYAHAQMAQLFVESIKQDKNKKYLMETHSQNFCLRMRRLVAEGYLSPSDIAIYYVDFDEEKNESSLERIYIDNLGRVSFWPDEIFNETLEETIAIRTAQINSQNVV